MKLDTNAIIEAVHGLASQHGLSLLPYGRQAVATGSLRGRTVTVQHESRLPMWKIIVGVAEPVAGFALLARGVDHRGWGDRLQWGRLSPIAHPELETRYELRTRSRSVVEGKFAAPALLTLLATQAPLLYEWHTGKYGHTLYYRSDRSASAAASLSEGLEHAFDLADCFAALG